jgi:hypothetical protein
MSDWKRHWIEQIGNPIAQYDIWEEHWLALHPADAPPSEIKDEDDDEPLDRVFHNVEKYRADPEVEELFCRYDNVRNLDDARRAREAREWSSKLTEDLGYVGVCSECESAVFRTLNKTDEGGPYVWQCDSLICDKRTTTDSSFARPVWVRPTHDSIQ